MRTFSTFARRRAREIERERKWHVQQKQTHACIYFVHGTYRKTKFKYQILVIRTEQCLTFNRLPFDVWCDVLIDKWCMTIKESARIVNVTCLACAGAFCDFRHFSTLTHSAVCKQEQLFLPHKTEKILHSLLLLLLQPERAHDEVIFLF